MLADCEWTNFGSEQDNKNRVKQLKTKKHKRKKSYKLKNSRVSIKTGLGNMLVCKALNWIELREMPPPKGGYKTKLVPL
jgi:hypothetical protein